MIPLSPLRGEMSRSDRGGSAASDQIGLEMGSPPSAFGISPARGRRDLFKGLREGGEEELRKSLLTSISVIPRGGYDESCTSETPS